MSYEMPESLLLTLIFVLLHVMMQMVDGSMDATTLEGDADTFLVNHVDNVSNLIDCHFQYVSFA
jgi:hypothetical protein